MSDDYEAAALKDPCFRFMHRINKSIGNPPNEISSFRDQAASVRAKANSLTDKKWRRAYIGWCNWIDRKIDASEVAFRKGPERRRRYEEDRAQREESTRRLLECNPVR